MVYLERRGKWFYYRVRIPHELQPCFGGKIELKVSLRSRRYDIAKRMVKGLSYSTEQLFTLLRRNLTLLPEAQLKKLVADHFRQALDDAEEARLHSENLLLDHGEGDDDPLEGLELHLVELQEDLAFGRYTSGESTADTILSQAGLTGIPKDSLEYRRVCRESLKGVIEATRIELARLRGNYATTQTPAEALSKAQADTPPSTVRLSSLIEDHIKEMSGGKRWTSKTQAENESIYRVLLEALGDVPVSTLNHKVMVQFRDTLTRLPSNMNKKPEYRGKSIPELLKLKAEKTLSTNTTNKYLNRVSSLLKWAAKRELIHQNFAEGLNISRRNSKDSEDLALQKLLNS